MPEFRTTINRIKYGISNETKIHEYRVLSHHPDNDTMSCMKLKPHDF